VLLSSSCLLCRHPGAVVCGACAAELSHAPSMPPPLWVDRCDAPFDYAQVGPAITALKNGDRRDLVPWLAAHLAACTTPPATAVVTWAPTTAARRRQRGFDQAELLARAVARRWGLPCRSCLVRAPGPAQAGRSGAQRRTNPRFRARGRVPSAVVVVDDVVTTGATAAAAARALRAAGTSRVLAVVAARARGPAAA